MVDQRRDVLVGLAQRRHRDGIDGQGIEEVRLEQALTVPKMAFRAKNATRKRWYVMPPEANRRFLTQHIKD
jgi:hypothetical protein